MPQTRTQTCTDQHNKHRFIAFSAGSKRMQKEAAAADRVRTLAHRVVVPRALRADAGGRPLLGA